MDLARLGGMVAQAQEEQGISDYLLEHEIGVVNGKAFNAKQLDRLKKRQRVLPVPQEVVWQLIRILNLDPYEAAEAAGVLLPGWTADMLRRLDVELVAVGTGRGSLTHRSVKHQAHVKGLGQLIPFPLRLAA
jgi:hypothetical protein